MEVEIPTVEGPSTGSGTGSLTPALVEMLRGGSLSGLGMLLSSAQLSPEQRMLVDVLQSLQSTGSKPQEPDIDFDAENIERVRELRPRRRERYEEIDDDDNLDDEADEAPDEPPDSVQRELADLREVNDTLAAALGACRVCWGGDDHCPVCAGDGHSGAEEPNAALFEALVVPAVRRMRARRPMRSRMASGSNRE